MDNFNWYIEKAKEFNRINVDVEEGNLHIYVKGQEWSNQEAQKELKEIDIHFASCGVLPVRIIKRKNYNPLIQIGSEDDGHIWFSEDSSFDIYWVDCLISDLKDAVASCNERNLITFRREMIT